MLQIGCGYKVSITHDITNVQQYLYSWMQQTDAIMTSLADMQVKHM